MPVVTSDEKLAAETRLRSSATKQRITQPAILTAVALQRIIDGVYKTWKEAGDDLGLSARQRKELREQVEASRALDYYFAAVEEQPQRSSEQQEDEAEEAEREADMDTEMDAALGDSGKPEVHVPAAGQQQEDRAGEHLADEDVARMRRACSFQGTDDNLRA